MKSLNDSTDNTRERILSAAEKLFAEKGYNGVSIREITQAAKCNLAAVNYYFGNKQNLYYDVFRYQLVPRLAKNKIIFEENLKKQTDINLETVVRALTLVIMDKSLNDSDNQSLHNLMQKEISNPTAAIEIIIKDSMIPFFGVLVNQLKKYLPDDIDDIKMKLNVFSIIAMSLYFAHARMPVAAITGKEYNENFVDKLIDHIVSFSIHGLHGKPRKNI